MQFPNTQKNNAQPQEQGCAHTNEHHKKDAILNVAQPQSHLKATKNGIFSPAAFTQHPTQHHP